MSDTRDDRQFPQRAPDAHDGYASLPGTPTGSPEQPTQTAGAASGVSGSFAGPQFQAPSDAPTQGFQQQAGFTPQPAFQPSGYQQADLGQNAQGAPDGVAHQQWQVPPVAHQVGAPMTITQVLPPRAARPAAARVVMQTPVTWSIIAICVLVWIGERASLNFADHVVLSPYFGRTQPWRFVTSAFAHALSPAHIAFNMYALWTLRMLEVYLGRLKFAAVYLLCAIAGGAAFVVLAHPLTMQWLSGVVGASGAIFGLFGVLLFAYRDLQASTRQLWIVIAINMAISFTIPGIAWQAHVGGFLMGLLAGWLLLRERLNRRNGHADRSWLWLGALFVLEVVVLLIKYQMAGHTWIN